ncbi:ER lumen protein-retaining receptor A [Vitis vinifera]|uniref:ER lumen protein-retaining receptor n=1 Tax=Vitis vinifera TaxID=29760 RepID=A0A438HH14_VITVI|nr:ER lumen protein-retaining receptor A [Vitis vinifera]
MNIFRLAGDMTHLMSILVLLLKIYATKSCSGISLKTQELYALVFLTRYLDLFTDFISVYNTVMKLVFIGSSLAIVWCMRMHRTVKRSYDGQLDTFRHYFLVAACFLSALIVHEKFTFQEVTHYCAFLVLPDLLKPAKKRISRLRRIDNFIFCSSLSLTKDVRSVIVFLPLIVLMIVAIWPTAIVNVYLLQIFWAFSIYLEAVAILPQLVLLQRSGNVDNLTGQYVFFLGAYRALYILNWIYRYFTEQHFSRWIACISGLVQTALYADFFYYYFISWKNNSKLQLPA